jgi:Arc/MetJ family transcription regulator
MPKTLIDIPEELLAEAMEVLGATTKAEAVRTALAIVTRQHRQRAVLGWIAESGVLADLNDPDVRAAARR